MSNIYRAVLLGLVLLLPPVTAMGAKASAEMDTGVLACVGMHRTFMEEPSTNPEEPAYPDWMLVTNMEERFNITLFNFNDTVSITVKRMRIYGQNGGEPIYDSDLTSFPQNPANLGFPAVLGPHKRFGLSSGLLALEGVEIISDENASKDAYQIIFDWESDGKGSPLVGYRVRNTFIYHAETKLFAGGVREIKCEDINPQ